VKEKPMTTEGEARYRRMQARMDAQAAERHNARVAASKASARPAAAAPAVVRPATEAQFQQLLTTITETTERYRRIAEVAPAATPVTEAEPEKPVKALHEMNNVEFRAHAAEAWSHVAVAQESPAWVRRPPMTISDYIAGGGSR
jgi:hypothetical protein